MTQQFEILDDRILVQMIPLSPSQGELYLPKFDTFSADDGRTKTRLSDDTFTTKGKVVTTGLAYKGPLLPDQEVYISHPSLHKYHFNPNSELNYTGLVLVHQSLIDARVNDTFYKEDPHSTRASA